MNQLNTARDAVLAQLEPIAAEAQELRTRLALLESTEAQLKAALKALAPSTKTTGKAAKPCVKKADVQAALEAIVTDNPGVAKADLIDLAKDKLSRDWGFNLSLTGRWFPECLASPVFKIAADETVTLTSAPQQNMAPNESTMAAHLPRK